MRVAAALLLLLAPAVAGAQELAIPPVTYPTLSASAAGAEGFVPHGWTIAARRERDLNGDGAADLALLLKMADPANVIPVPSGDETVRFDTNPHLLLVAFAEAGGGYRRVAANHGLFIRPDQPFTGDVPPGADSLRLERGSLVVFFEYLRGWASYRFGWRAGEMRLIGYDDAGASGGCATTTSINYLTGRARITAGRIDQDRSRIVSRRLNGVAPPTLDAIDLTSFAAEEAIAGEPVWCRGE